jgi:hypothetical protein
MNKNKIILFSGITVLILFIASLFSNELQNIVIVVELFVFNYILYQINKEDPKVYIFSIIYLAIVVTLTFFEYYNAKSLGFSDGIYGILEKNDTVKYFYESKKLADILKSDFIGWCNGNYVKMGYYGNYNQHVLLCALLIVIFGANAISIILLKLHFNIWAFFLIYRIGIKFNVKRPYIIPFVFGLYPGYLLPSITTLRDNVLSLWTILFVFMINKSETIEKQSKIRMIFVTLGMLWARVYSVLLLPIAIFYKKIFRNKSGGYYIGLIFAVIAGSILIFINYTTLTAIFLTNTIELNDISSSYMAWIDRSLSNVIFRASYFHLLGSKTKINEYDLQSISDTLNYLSSFFHRVVLLLSFMSSVYFIVKKDRINSFVVYFANLFPIAILLFYTYALGGPVPRIYSMWLWINILISIKYLESSSHKILITSSILILSTVTLIFYPL